MLPLLSKPFSTTKHVNLHASPELTASALSGQAFPGLIFSEELAVFLSFRQEAMQKKGPFRLACVLCCRSSVDEQPPIGKRILLLLPPFLIFSVSGNAFFQYGQESFSLFFLRVRGPIVRLYSWLTSLFFFFEIRFCYFNFARRDFYSPSCPRNTYFYYKSVSRRFLLCGSQPEQ